ncbi:MAG: hypothetical protein ABUT39_07100 [Acidobacteriota bacterium]
MSIPAVPVDEALELFLALAFPNGLPEGIDRAALVEQMRTRIAGDRPEWAAASHGDPHEQYLEERRREADEHRARRQEEARVEEARADLLRRLLARKREAREVREAHEAEDAKERLAVLRGFGESLRTLLKRREDLLADRRPVRRAERFEPLGFSETPAVKPAAKPGLTLKEAPARRDRLRPEL